MSGAAGLLWRSCSDCPRETVVDCLLSTADDAGAPGKDVYYGEGILNTKSAFDCLRQRPCCMSPEAEEISAIQVPSLSPSRKPTAMPTYWPSLAPTTSVPTRFPTSFPTYVMTTSAPTRFPTSFPTYVPSLSPTPASTCNEMCEDKNQFCLYQAEKLCLNGKVSCVNSCQEAVLQGTIGSGLLDMCQKIWCVTEMEDCVAQKRESCTSGQDACKSRCA